MLSAWTIPSCHILGSIGASSVSEVSYTLTAPKVPKPLFWTDVPVGLSKSR